MQNISKVAYAKKKENIIYLLTVACLSVEACVTSAFEIVRKLGTFPKVLAWIWYASTLDWKRAKTRHKFLLNEENVFDFLVV